MLSTKQIKTIQQYLLSRGYSTIEVNGEWDIKTQVAYNNQCLTLGVNHPSLRSQPMVMESLPKEIRALFQVKEATPSNPPVPKQEKITVNDDSDKPSITQVLSDKKTEK